MTIIKSGNFCFRVCHYVPLDQKVLKIGSVSVSDIPQCISQNPRVSTFYYCHKNALFLQVFWHALCPPPPRLLYSGLFYPITWLLSKEFCTQVYIYKWINYITIITAVGFFCLIELEGNQTRKCSTFFCFVFLN